MNKHFAAGLADLLALLLILGGEACPRERQWPDRGKLGGISGGGVPSSGGSEVET